MTMKDIRSDLLPKLAMNADITSDTDTIGAAIDTAKHELGIVFTFAAATYTDGIFTPAIEESDDVGFSSPSDVDAERLIGTIANATISGAQSEGDEIPSLGAFSTKRFLRVKQVSTSVTSGARILVTSHQAAESSPAVT